MSEDVTARAPASGWGQVFVPLTAVTLVSAVALSGADSHLVWYSVRAAGIVAYVLLAVSVVAGLLVSGRSLPAGQSRVDLFDVHNFTTLVAIAFASFHAVALLLDSYIGFAPRQIVVPFTSDYRPVAVGAGILGLYLAIAVYSSFWLRRVLGYRAWRAFHYSAFIAFLLATLHGIFGGADSGATWMIGVYLGATVPVLGLILMRVLTTPRVAPSARTPPTEQAPSGDDLGAWARPPAQAGR